ncbi:RecX family transcriptional regulator [Solitalea sp. MAHUQ-68]|uniref:Regulatory protein RecX n=1 Tax=Solitalea agri TaxID=2953739 RepID=A0A9X2F4H4_9SPHI|nr:regulatory protein RecX [Solitalea agri]MCO4291678.1 RecX family transcriptional regulator [Solitalea agri]
MLQDESPKKRITDPKIALEKASKFCAYQERSQQEVRSKLYEWGLWTEAVEEIISDLIVNNFINEERFARAYSLGKFRMKQWGRIKIKQGLKLKGVSENLIKKGLASIDGNDYEQTLIHLFEKRDASEKESDNYKRKFKISQYLISRGFESDLVWNVINEHSKK